MTGPRRLRGGGTDIATAANFVLGSKNISTRDSANDLCAACASRRFRTLQTSSSPRPPTSPPIFSTRKRPNSGRELREVQYTPLVTVTAFVSRDSFTRHLSGVGVLVPQGEGHACLDILFNSSAFEGRVNDESSQASFTILFGGALQPHWITAPGEEIEQAVRQELSAIPGIRGEPLQLVDTHWRRAIPQYSTRLPRVWQTARETWCASLGHVLFGNYTGQVSLRGMIETVKSFG